MPYAIWLRHMIGPALEGLTGKGTPLYIYNEARHSVPGLCLVGKLEFKCKSRGMETCLHFRGAALNARETGIFCNYNVSNLFSHLISSSVSVYSSLGSMLGYACHWRTDIVPRPPVSILTVPSLWVNLPSTLS